MSIYSSVFYQGISEKRIHITVNSSTILKLVKYDKIDKINIGKKNDDLQIKICAYRNTFTQIYDIDYEVQISEMLAKNHQIQIKF